VKSNFDFTEKTFPTITKVGSLAESYLYSDPNACLYKIGMIAEYIVNTMFEIDILSPPAKFDTLDARIKILNREGLLPKEIRSILFALRTKRNKAVHTGLDSFEDASTLLEMAFRLSVWFMRTYGDSSFEAVEYVPPIDHSKDADYGERIAAMEQVASEANAGKTEYTYEAKLTAKIADRRKRAEDAIRRMRLSEKETRMLIDEQLRKVGWEADSLTLRYSKGTRPQKGENIAIAEWPTDATVCKYGSADYALFSGEKLVGVIEAKAVHKDISSVVDYQSSDYSRGIRTEDAKYLVGSWGDYKVPFIFSTNGKPYLKQLETKSGIWFRDARDPKNISKSLQGWISPQGLMDMLERDIDGADSALSKTSYDLLCDKDGLNLRPYQIEAIERTEEAIWNGRNTVLLAMATGTGKTRTVLGMIYRFLKSERFKRVLFVVDRTALGEQAQDVFKEVRIEELMTLDEIYDIKELTDKAFDKETRIQVATVQSLVNRILYNEEDTMPSVADYDLIIIDEAHRGYLLDREMSGSELEFSNQEDYVSKFRSVVEYFDAVKIALTATPALQTVEIFGHPVFEYSYRRAVVEGYLVDHDAPHLIITHLSDEGIRYEAGETLAMYDPVTGEITNSDELEDEVVFEVDSFNTQVITEPFNRTAFAEIAEYLNPEGDGKTLIFAVDDNHADLIVKILRDIYEPMGVHNDAIMKITGSVGGGNPKKVLEAVKRFKNEQYPNIAVTVDLLTTGIDVPEITTLVFMRRVKSRILFEQMMGRATRLCPEINKTHFEIFDPVGVYDSLAPVNTMRTVAKDPKTTLTTLVTELNAIDDEQQIKNQIDLIIAKIRRKSHNLSKDAEAMFYGMSDGQSPEEVVGDLLRMSPGEAKTHIGQKPYLFAVLDEGGLNASRPMIISEKPDALVSHTRGYGDGKSPGDYLEAFDAFIRDNVNVIAALKTICTKPSDLTRADLKALKLELDRNNFSEQQLNTAWRELKNEEIVADIISFIRRYAIGSPMISHEDRIKAAVDKLIHNHDFSKMQVDWLHRIEKSLLSETVIDRETFDSGAFESSGGFAKIDRIFSGRLNETITELNEYLYEDGGKTA
jgi:type I restriction enzyme R subunit